MGQGQSSPQEQERPTTPEPEISEEERAQAQAEMRAKQQAALDKRFANHRKPVAKSAVLPQSNKKSSALEEMSKENVGWRYLDAQSEIRRWE